MGKDESQPGGHTLLAWESRAAAFSILWFGSCRGIGQRLRQRQRKGQSTANGHAARPHRGPLSLCTPDHAPYRSISKASGSASESPLVATRTGSTTRGTVRHSTAQRKESTSGELDPQQGARRSTVTSHVGPHHFLCLKPPGKPGSCIQYYLRQPSHPEPEASREARFMHPGGSTPRAQRRAQKRPRRS